MYIFLCNSKQNIESASQPNSSIFYSLEVGSDFGSPSGEYKFLPSSQRNHFRFSLLFIFLFRFFLSTPFVRSAYGVLLFRRPG